MVLFDVSADFVRAAAWGRCPVRPGLRVPMEGRELGKAQLQWPDQDFLAPKSKVLGDSQKGGPGVFFRRPRIPAPGPGFDATCVLKYVYLQDQAAEFTDHKKFSKCLGRNLLGSTLLDSGQYQLHQRKAPDSVSTLHINSCHQCFLTVILFLLPSLLNVYFMENINNLKYIF